MKNRILFFLTLLWAVAGNVNAKSYYVSASGNNANNGLTQATAWQTISKVNSAFSAMAAGDSILFKRGDTFFGAITVGKSGTSLKPIVISAYGTGAKPVISGFLNPSAWVAVSNGVYQVALAGVKSTLNMVALNNIPQALGRYPNTDDANGGYLRYESFSDAASITDNELTSIIDWTGAEAVIRKKLWVLDRCKITGHSGTTLTYTNTNLSTYEGTNNYGYFIQNDPRTLDKLGEWYYNSSTKYLQMYFGTAAPSAYNVKVSAVDTLLILSSKTNVNINNLAFEGANVNAVFGINCGYINVQDCDFNNAGEGAIFFQTVSNALIENCNSNNILNSSIRVMNTKSSNVTIRGCQVKNTGLLPGMGLSNGNSYKGMYASVLSNLLIEYNKVDTSGYVGIEFQGSNVTVKNNVVNHFDFNKDDAGGIYSYASGTDADPGTVYTNRVVKENIVMNGVGAPQGRFGTSLFVSGIYMDGRTMNVDILNNTVFNNGKNGIHCNNPNNVNIKGNTSFNNLSAVSVMRWSWGGITNLSIQKNIFYPKTDQQRCFYYTNSGLNEPVTTTLQSALTSLGNVDSNYYNMANPVGFNFEIYETSGGALIPTSPLSLEGWRTFTVHDTASKRPAKSPISFKVNSVIGTNKFTNGLFNSAITGINLFGTNLTGVWDNTGKISGGSLKLSMTSPVANKYCLIHSPIGAITAGKKYVFRFSTYGTTEQGNIKVYLRKTISPYTTLVPVQTQSFGLARKNHEFLFVAPVTDAGASFVVEIEQNSGTTYFDNVELYEANATLYSVDSQLRFEYNDTKIVKTIPLDAVYTGVDGTIYNGASIALQPYTSIILVKDTSSRAPLSVSAAATAIKCFDGNSTVTVSAAGGTSPYTGAGTFTVRAGTYTYTVTDATGAAASTTITVAQPAVLKDSAVAPFITIAGGTTIVTVTASGGTAPYTGTGVFVSIGAGTYNYTVTDANACTATTSITITQPSFTYTLTTTATPTAGGTATRSPNTATYLAGTIVTLTATPAAGYVFTGWSGDATGTSTSIAVTMNASKSVVANYQLAAVNYTLTTTATPTAGGSVSRSPNAATYTSGTVITLTATPAAGYTFTGWSGDATGTAASVTVTMNANKVVTANFQAITYTLTTTATPTAGGTAGRSPNTTTYASGAVVTLTATPAAGYTFTGWSGDVTGTATSVTVTMNANKAVTANFQAITYTLTTTATPTAGGTVGRSPNTTTYASGAVVTLTATPAAGYTFTGWSGDVTGTATSVTVTMNSNKNVTANFLLAGVKYTLTATATPTVGGSVTRNPSAATYASGSMVTVTATPAAGYVFTGWSGDATGTATSATITINDNKNVVANFQPITYTLTTTATPTAGGSVTRSPNTTTYGSGTVVTLTATPAAGYTFTGWSGDATGTATSATVTMSANKTVTANFQAITYTLTTTATPTTGGSVTRSPNTTTYGSGTVVTLTATPAAGYTFTGWSGDATGTATSAIVTMSANKTVTANFQPITYTLTTTATPTAGGSVTRSPNTTTYGSGTVVTLTATPAAGYTFTGWSGDATGTATSATVTMSANKTITANFQLIAVNYTLTTTATPTAGGSVTRSPNTTTYASGTVVTLTANPAAGYTFTGWSGDATGTATSATVTMSANKTITANFQLTAVNYTLTTTATPTTGGSVTRSPNTTTYASGAVVTLTATPAAGYIFTGWSGDVTGTAASVTVTMNANKAVTANFQAITYVLSTLTTPATGIGGSISRSITAASYAPGTVLTLTAVPAAGYIFTGWSGAVTGTSISVSVTINANVTITANFVLAYTLTTTASPVLGGSISSSPAATLYATGTVVTVTATPAAGYKFTGWSGGATGTATSATVTMNANKTVTAAFAPIAITYTLSTVASPVAGGSVTGAGIYSSGASATLTATPAAGYVFTGWSGATGTTPTVNVVMSADKTVTASFGTITTLRVEDTNLGTSGLCSIEGTVSNNPAANNGRSINLTNSLGKGLNWSVDAGATGTYNLKWRYANGSTSNSFYMKLTINGIVVKDSMPFPKTTGSSSFLTTSSDFILAAGNNVIRLESIAAAATADIDWLEVSGYNPAIGNCSASAGRAATTTTTTTIAATRQPSGVYPNPSNGRINIGFDLAETQRVYITILDAAGYVVGNLQNQLCIAGHNVQSYNMAGKTPGIYTVLITGERNLRLSYKFLVVQ